MPRSMQPDFTQPSPKSRRRGIPWWLIILLILAAIIGTLALSCYSAHKTALEATDRLYSGLQTSNEAVINSTANGHAREKLAELQAKFGKVLSFQVLGASALPDGHWMANVRVTRERARTLEEVTNMGSGSVIKHVGGFPDSG